MRYKAPPPVPTKPDPYRAMIVARLEGCPQLRNVRMQALNELDDLQLVGSRGRMASEENKGPRTLAGSG